MMSKLPRFSLRAFTCSVTCALAVFGCTPSPRGEAATQATSRGPAQPSAAGIRRTLVGRAPAHEPGWETRLYLVEYPPGAAAPPHVHPVPGVGWVIEGEFESAFGDELVVKVHAGEAFYDRGEVAHRVFRNPNNERVLRFVIAYTIRTEDENFRLLR